MTLIAFMSYSGATTLISNGITSISSKLVAPLLLIMGPAAGSVYTTAAASTIAFAPIAGPLMETIGNPKLAGVLCAMAVSGTLTTASPLSISGAMYVAAVKNEDKDIFYKKMLMYGLSMIILGSLVSWLVCVVIF